MYRIVTKARQVPHRLERLKIARSIGRPTGKLVLAGARSPDGAPALPGVRLARRFELCALPFTVHTELHFGDRAFSGPGAACNAHCAGLDDTASGIEVWNSRRRKQRIDAHQAARLAFLAGGAAEMVAARLLQAVERLLERFDRAQPLHARHAV